MTDLYNLFYHVLLQFGQLKSINVLILSGGGGGGGFVWIFFQLLLLKQDDIFVIKTMNMNNFFAMFLGNYQ